MLSDIDLLLRRSLLHLILGLRYLFDHIGLCLHLTTRCYPTLLILLNPAYLIVLATVRALPLLGLHLMVVTLVTNLIFAITWIELLLHLFEIYPADVANIIPSNPIALVGELGERLVLCTSLTICAFLAA